MIKIDFTITENIKSKGKKKYNRKAFTILF